MKIWITPFASVAMLEKLALLKIALCSAPALTIDSWVRTGVAAPATGLEVFLAAVSAPDLGIGLPNSNQCAAGDSACRPLRL